MLHDNVLNRPSYSINGILGIPQQDANANINKRKREDEGELPVFLFPAFPFSDSLLLVLLFPGPVSYNLLWP
jgi:hypothetical protein